MPTEAEPQVVDTLSRVAARSYGSLASFVHDARIKMLQLAYLICDD